MTVRIYRNSLGQIDWQMTMAREWATEVKGWEGAQGGWVYAGSTAKYQGWGSVYAHNATEILDWYTRKLTAFDSFLAMLTAPGTYRPTLISGGRGGWRFEALAAAYNQSQGARGDARRAYQG